MEYTAMDESGREEEKCEVREWATAIKNGARYDNIELGPEHEALKASGRRENKIKGNPITEERGMKQTVSFKIRLAYFPVPRRS